MSTRRSSPTGDIKTTDDLLDPKWKGKIASYDPSVNGGGLIYGSVIYVTKGQDFAKQLYQGQEIAYTRDYQQIADWVAHDSYPVALAATPIYIAQYKAGAAAADRLQRPQADRRGRLWHHLALESGAAPERRESLRQLDRE